MIFAEAEENFIAQLSFLYNTEEAKEIFSIALEHVSHIRKIQWLARKKETVSAINGSSLMQILNELKTGRPIQYITGETEFFGLRFKVNPDVLIPRSETEELVDWIIKDAGEKNAKAILDIGTGSGCIPISIKKYFPQSEVWGLDISQKALETAMRNALLNKTEVKFVQADILEPGFYISNQKFDLIVSNPPYVTKAEKGSMHSNVLEHEPYLALFVEDDDPLIFYERIADFAKKHLTPNGALFFEINESLGSQVTELLIGKGFVDIELRKDMQGKDRMAFCHAEAQSIF